MKLQSCSGGCTAGRRKRELPWKCTHRGNSSQICGNSQAQLQWKVYMGQRTWHSEERGKPICRVLMAFEAWPIEPSKELTRSSLPVLHS
ncbi:Hypothetical predicted protein [Podarcis lilfordi]|uniref:Uncharacterized protein n=1 Tax=Podarcis lilfordi TaxID=74358 RepID=A0AA35PJP1_9SAUR|nr:Hypothetical predicted protein [Podarcis lilfordi]